MSTTKQMRKYNGTLRPYQFDGVVEVRKSLAVGPTLLVSPTGAGKTNMAAVIAEDYRNVLFVAHRRELLSQASVPMGSHVVRMSIQSALRYGPDNVQCLIIDEAHRARAKTYRLLIEKYSTAARLGLTATPLRTDGQGLCDAFSQLVPVSSMKELVHSGHLVPYVPFDPPDEALEMIAKLKRLKKVGGDYEARSLSALVNTPRLVGRVVDEYLRYATGRRAVVFAVSVAHSKALEAAFLKSNVRAIHIDGRASARQRDAALARVARGEIEVLCNVNLFTEGWDCPAVSCVIMARPTESLTLYLQCVGRGMRPDELSGKTNLLILDHAGNMARHGMPDEDREWSLESRQQRERRERETAELERIYTLGFDSLEQYRLEQRTILTIQRSDYYCSSEAAAVLGYSDKHVRRFLAHRGIERIARRIAGVRYPKQPIDAIAQLLKTSYSSQQCGDLLGYPSYCVELVKSLKKHNVFPIRQFNLIRFSRAEIDGLRERFADLRLNGISGTDAARYIGVSRAYLYTLCAKHGMESTILARQEHYYRRPDIERLATIIGRRSTAETFSGSEVHQLLDLTPTKRLRDMLGYHNIVPVSGYGMNARYQKSDIYPLIDIRSKTYSTKECVALLKANGLIRGSVCNSWFSTRKIVPASHGRFLKVEVDDAIRTSTSDTYSIAECRAILGLQGKHSVSPYMKRINLHPAISYGAYARYRRSDVDAFRDAFLATIHALPDATLRLGEIAELFNIEKHAMLRILAKYGIQKIVRPHKKPLYNKLDIDKLLITYNASQSVRA